MVSVEKPPKLRDEDFARLGYRDKLVFALALFRAYGLKVLGVVLTGLLGLLMGGIFLAGASSAALGQGSGLVVLSLLLVWGLFLVFTVGLNTLLLRYSEGAEPPAAWPVVVGAWADPLPLLKNIGFWMAVTFLYKMFFSLFGEIPLVGEAIDLLASLLLSTFLNCALFYLADRGGAARALESLLLSLLIVRGAFGAWLAGVATVLALSLPGVGFLLWGLRGGGPVPPALLLLVGLGLVLAANTYGQFFLVLTYRQTKAALGLSGHGRA